MTAPGTAPGQASEPVPCEHHWVSQHKPGHALYWVRLCGFCGDPDWDDLDREIAQAIAAAAPARSLDGDTAELATLRELRVAVAHFAETWAELLPDLPDSYGCEMNCGEANAAAGLYRAIGDDATAAAILANHADHDEEGDQHCHGPMKGSE